MIMKKPSKKKILEMLSKNLEVFYPSLKNHFMCPTCLKQISLKEKHRISEAHIIPKAAAGQFKTYLCSDCNSRFGSRQDKWFGEFVRLTAQKKPSILSTNIKDGYFLIDGVRANGQWQRDDNNNLEFQIHVNRNSPLTDKLIQDKFAAGPTKLQLSIPLPLLRHRRLVDIGFLTAAYLMWFGALGYSWVLQDHLDSIRKQILNPDEDIITAKYLFSCKPVRWKPWFGVVPIGNDFVPAVGINTNMVVFPPRDRPTFYKRLGDIQQNTDLSEVRAVRLSERPYYGPPVVLLFEDRILVAPDSLAGLEGSVVAIRFSRESKHASIMHAVSKDEFERLKLSENAIVIKAGIRA